MNRRLIGIRNRQNLGQRLGPGEGLGEGECGDFLERLGMERTRQADDQGQSYESEEDLQWIRFRDTITHFECSISCRFALPSGAKRPHVAYLAAPLLPVRRFYSLPIPLIGGKNRHATS